MYKEKFIKNLKKRYLLAARASWTNLASIQDQDEKLPRLSKPA